MTKHNEGASLVALLRVCAKSKDLCRGARLHEDIVKGGLLRECSDALVAMYVKCGALARAKDLLGVLKSRDIFSWTALIAGYVQKGQGQDALDCFEWMEHERLCLDAVTLSCILKACGIIGAFDKGKQIHCEITRQGLLQNSVVLGTALVDMYAKCGALTEAQEAVENIPVRNITSWNALIAGYVQQDQGEQALHCYQSMQYEGLTPDVVTFTCMLKACGSIEAVDKGQELHDEVTKQGLLGENVMLSNALVDMYAKCGALREAKQVLDGLLVRDVISWNALVGGYVQQCEGEQALSCLEKMQQDGISPDRVTFLSLMKACGIIGAPEKGRQFHAELARKGMLRDDVGNVLVDMYARCGALLIAQELLEKLLVRDVSSWNALITGYTQHGQGEQAIKCFERMQSEGLVPNTMTFACILKACGTVGAAEKGEQVHDLISKQGLLGSSVVLSTAVVDMYAKCGALEKAKEVLEEISSQDVASWNALIAGYAQQGRSEQAWSSYKQMEQEGISPNIVTFACLVKVCAIMGDVDKGEQIHDKIAREGLEDDLVLGASLVDMYAKCGALVKARQVLEDLSFRDIVCWNALIAGYTQQDKGEEALNCLEKMQGDGLSPDTTTFVCLLKACGSIGAVDKGEQFHDEATRRGLIGKSLVLGTALVDMYAKCGDLAKARLVLEELGIHDAGTWNALIAGYVQRDHGKQALECFERMELKSFSPNEVTFSCVLNACNRLGLIEDAEKHFASMTTKYGIQPEIEHCTCMVALFGRIGHLGKAVELVQKMQSSVDTELLSCLLGACQKWGDVNTGRWAFQRAVQLDNTNVAVYILMANIYAAAGMHEDAGEIEAMGNCFSFST